MQCFQPTPQGFELVNSRAQNFETIVHLQGVRKKRTKSVHNIHSNSLTNSNSGI